MFNKKKGFTLIELLAVIVILGVILLIAVPSVVEMIMKSKEKSFLISAGRILDATSLKIGSDFNESIYENIDLSTLEYKGKRYEIGSIKVDNDSNLAVALWNPELKLCAYKGYTDKEITIDRNRDLANCVIGVSELNLTNTDPEYSCITFDAGTKTITQFSGCPTVVRIPTKIDGVDVEYIGSFAFMGGSIDEMNFNYATKLIEIKNNAVHTYFYSQVKSIVGLEKATSLISIGDEAFNTQEGITSVTLPNSLQNIGRSAFSGNKLTTITIPSSVTNIGENAFSSNNLTSIIIPATVTNLGNYAFNCSTLTSATIKGKTNLNQFPEYYQYYYPFGETFNSSNIIWE